MSSSGGREWWRVLTTRPPSLIPRTLLTVPTLDPPGHEHHPAAAQAALHQTERLQPLALEQLASGKGGQETIACREMQLE